MSKVDILAIGVHPDDVELSCAGTIIKHIQKGYTVAILDLTRGELGTRGSAELRQQEANAAAKILGVNFRDNAGLADGFFEHCETSIRAIIPFIRKYKPDIVLANALDDRHPDHGRAAKLTADACFYAGLRRIETFDHDGNPQEAWRPKTVFHYIQDVHLTPDFVIDISPYFNQKMDAIMAFGSQFFNPAQQTGEPQTPISSKSFMMALQGKNSVFARSIGTEYAEGFNFSRTPGIDDLFHLI